MKNQPIPECHEIRGLLIEPVPHALLFKDKKGRPFEWRKFWDNLPSWLQWSLVIVFALNAGTFIGWLMADMIVLK